MPSMLLKQFLRNGKFTISAQYGSFNAFDFMILELGWFQVNLTILAFNLLMIFFPMFFLFIDIIRHIAFRTSLDIPPTIPQM